LQAVARKAVPASLANLDAHIWTAVTLRAGTAAVLPEMAVMDGKKQSNSAPKVGKKDWEMRQFHGLERSPATVVTQSVFASFGK
jgi:hypothetical protein